MSLESESKQTESKQTKSKQIEKCSCGQEEKWKTIKGFEKYDVSDHGRVRNASTYILKITIAPNISLQNAENQGKSALVRNLVAEAFLEPMPPEHVIENINGNKKDNHVSNLKWSKLLPSSSKYKNRTACYEKTCDFHDEVWKNIKNFPSYEISNHGRIKIVKTKQLMAFKGSKYLCVQIHDEDGKPHEKSVHVLVAQEFIENNDIEAIEVNHKNGNCKDAHVSNLEWTSHVNNMIHAKETGLIKNRLTRVQQIDLKTSNVIREFKSVGAAAKEMNVANSNISEVCGGTQKTSCGFGWRYSVEKPDKHLPDEIWKKHPIFHQLSVSNKGRFKSDGKKLPSIGSKTPEGYRSTTVDDKHKQIHVLVAETFIEQIDLLKIEVNHKNKIRHDNRVENLEWATSQENNEHAHGKPIDQYDLKGKFIASFKTTVAAAESIKRTKSSVTSCLKGRTKTCGGFTWKYAKVDDSKSTTDDSKLSVNNSQLHADNL